MIKLLIILFIIKLYVWNVFECIKKGYEQDVTRIVRWYESLKTKYVKVTADTKFIMLCKVERIIPTFAKVIQLKSSLNLFL